MSAVLVAAQLLLHGGPDTEDWLQPLLCALFPWTLHHTHTLRSGHVLLCGCLWSQGERSWRFGAHVIQRNVFCA